MKVFQLSEYETWFGPNLETVIAESMKETGCTIDEILDSSYHELTEEDLAKVKVKTGEEDDSPVVSGTEALAQEIAEGKTVGYLFGTES